MPTPVSSTDADARLAAYEANRRDNSFAEEILGAFVSTGRSDAIEAALVALASYRPVNPPLVPLDLPDTEIDELAFAEACEHVFRNAPSPIVGPIPR